MSSDKNDSAFKNESWFWGVSTIKWHSFPKNYRYNFFFDLVILTSKQIEIEQRGIRGEKSSKDIASSRNLVSTIGAQASPKKGDGTRCQEG